MYYCWFVHSDKYLGGWSWTFILKMVLIFWSCEAPSNLREGSVSGSSMVERFMVERPLLAAAPVAFTRHLQARFTLGVDPRRGWEVADAITGVGTALWGLTQCCPDCRHSPACSPALFQRALSVQKAAASTQPASPKALLVHFLWGRDIVCVLHCLSAGPGAPLGTDILTGQPAANMTLQLKQNGYLSWDVLEGGPRVPGCGVGWAEVRTVFPGQVLGDWGRGTSPPEGCLCLLWGCMASGVTEAGQQGADWGSSLVQGQDLVN